MLSPDRPLGEVFVPISPAVDVLGTPGWLKPLVLFPIGNGAIRVGGVAGDMPGLPGSSDRLGQGTRGGGEG